MSRNHKDVDLEAVSVGPDHTALGWIVFTVIFLATAVSWFFASPVYMRYLLSETTLNGSTSESFEVKQNGSIPGRGQNELAVVFFDTKYGDGIVIQAPDGTMTLIDGGEGRFPDNKNAPPLDLAHRLYLPFFRKIDRRKLENVISTVPYSHHMGVLPDLIANQNIEVSRLFHSGYPARFYNYRRMEVLAKEMDVETQVLEEGDKLPVGEGVKAVVLHAEDDVKLKSRASRVLFLKYGDKEFLFMSDLPVESEEDLVLRWGNDVKADVLKVGRHGAGDATSRNLVKFVDPSHAVISVNEKNPLGAPSKEVLKRLKQFNVESILRTDKHGHVAMFTDGEDIRIKKKAYQFL